MLKKLLWSTLGVIAIAGAGTFYWQVIREPDWNASAIEDVNFIRDTISYSHPGPVDASNPGFNEQLAAAHEYALSLARQVKTPAGYMYAVRASTAPFEDAHLVAQFFQSIPRQRRWPGFVVELNDRDEIAVTTSESGSAPPVGATLIDCDGKTPETLYNETILPFLHLSWLEPEYSENAPLLLIDSDNPFVAMAESCRFETEGEVAQYDLQWQPLTEDKRSELWSVLFPRMNQTTDLTFINDSIAWVSAASFFDSEESGNEDLANLIAKIEAEHDRISDASALVIDVRGNGGGSSVAGYRIAEALWGKAYIQSRLPTYTSADWRASDENVDRIQNFMLPLRIRFGSDSDLYQRVSAIETGLTKANADGKDFFVQVQPPLTHSDADPLPLPKAIYFLTDSSCVSACLDFADLMVSLDGVVHIGRATAGDTTYLEVATAKLPSGIGQLVYPTAVHRDRLRENNAIHTPTISYKGDITRTEEIADWIQNSLLTKGDE